MEPPGSSRANALLPLVRPKPQTWTSDFGLRSSKFGIARTAAEEQVAPDRRGRVGSIPRSKCVPAILVAPMARHSRSASGLGDNHPNDRPASGLNTRPLRPDEYPPHKPTPPGVQTPSTRDGM